MPTRPTTDADLRRQRHAFGEFMEAVPNNGDFADDAEFEQWRETRPLPINFNNPDVYFVPLGYLERKPPLTILVDWYIIAHGLWQDVVLDGVVMEGEPRLVVDFRQSYVGYCMAYGISPEQGEAWQAIYRCLRLLGYEAHPTLEFFMAMRSNAHCIVNGGE